MRVRVLKVGNITPIQHREGVTAHDDQKHLGLCDGGLTLDVM